MREDTPCRPNWASLLLVATVARLLCRELTIQNEYLRRNGLPTAPERGGLTCGSSSHGTRT